MAPYGLSLGRHFLTPRNGTQADGDSENKGRGRHFCVFMCQDRTQLYFRNGGKMQPPRATFEFTPPFPGGVGQFLDNGIYAVVVYRPRNGKAIPCVFAVACPLIYPDRVRRNGTRLRWGFVRLPKHARRQPTQILCRRPLIQGEADISRYLLSGLPCNGLRGACWRLLRRLLIHTRRP